jgi:ABC-type multidrug transport system fused ATPase/permease subunit
MAQTSYLEQDEVKGEIRDFHSFTYLLRYAASEKLKITLALILLACKSAFDITSAWFVGQLVEKGLAQKDWDIAIKFTVIIIAVEALAVLSIWNGRRIFAHASCSFILNIRRTLF